jgi:hypothetical protein
MLRLVASSFLHEVVSVRGGGVSTHPFTCRATSCTPVPSPIFVLIGLIGIFGWLVEPVWPRRAFVALCLLVSLVTRVGFGTVVLVINLVTKGGSVATVKVSLVT